MDTGVSPASGRLRIFGVIVGTDRFYRRYRGLICAGAAIAAAGGIAVFVALALAPAFEESSLGAGVYGFFGAWYGVLLLADAVVLFIRLRRAGKIARRH